MNKLGLLILISILICSFSCQNNSGELANKVEQQEAEIQNLKKKLNEVEEKITSETVEQINNSESSLNCSFEDFRYEEKDDDRVYLRLYNYDKSLKQVDISGQSNAGVNSFGVKAKIEGNKLKVISGNATGELTLLSDCKILVGSLKSKDNGEVDSFDLVRK